jgi:hypothetical protein
VGTAIALAAPYAPAPDFRYVGLEPIPRKEVRVAATAFGLGAGVTLALSGLDTRDAFLAGAVGAVLSIFALRGAGAGSTVALSGSARMAIVPWGVLVETDESPRILRWAAVRRIEVETAARRARGLLGSAVLASRVAIETAHDRFVGEAIGVVTLERLVENLDAYATEQSSPIALDLEGLRGEDALEAHEPSCEALLDSARGWLESGGAATHLALPPAGYRRASTHAASPRTVDVLRAVLRDRTPKAADPRPFAAVVAAELRAIEVAPELVALTQCPHPLVAAVARQAARKLGVPKAKTGTLDEVAPFLWGGDEAFLDAWVRS